MLDFGQHADGDRRRLREPGHGLASSLANLADTFADNSAHFVHCHGIGVVLVAGAYCNVDHRYCSVQAEVAVYLCLSNRFMPFHEFAAFHVGEVVHVVAARGLTHPCPQGIVGHEAVHRVPQRER